MTQQTPDIKPCTCDVDGSRIYHDKFCPVHGDKATRNTVGQAPTDPHSDGKTCPTCGNAKDNPHVAHSLNLNGSLVCVDPFHGSGRIASEGVLTETQLNEAMARLDKVVDAPGSGVTSLPPLPTPEAQGADKPCCTVCGTPLAIHMLAHPDPSEYAGKTRRISSTDFGSHRRPKPQPPTEAVTADGLGEILNAILRHHDHPQDAQPLDVAAIEAHYNAKFERLFDKPAGDTAFYLKGELARGWYTGEQDNSPTSG